MKASFKRIALLSMTLFMVVGLVACGSGSKKEKKETEQDANEIIEKAMKASKDVESYEATVKMTMDLDIKAKSESFEYKEDFDSTVLVGEGSENAYISGEATLETSDDSKSIDIEKYYTLNDDEYDVYENRYDDWTEDTDDVDAFVFGTTEDSLEILNDVKKLKYDGEDKVNKEKTYVLKGNLSFDSLEEMGNSILGYGGDMESFLADLEGDETFPVTIQFFQKTGEFAGISVDIGSALEKSIKDNDEFADSLEEDLDIGTIKKISVNEYVLSIEMVEYNAVDEDDVEVPSKVIDQVSGNTEPGTDPAISTGNADVSCSGILDGMGAEVVATSEDGDVTVLKYTVIMKYEEAGITKEQALENQELMKETLSDVYTDVAGLSVSFEFRDEGIALIITMDLDVVEDADLIELGLPAFGGLDRDAERLKKDLETSGMTCK